MKKISLFLLFTFASILLSEAQDNAKSILDKASSTFIKDSGVKAEFNLQVSEQGRPKGQTDGTICIKGEKFMMDTPESITWFDGKTQWSYVVTSGEVNISNPTREELQTINPYLLLSTYKKGFTYELGKAKTFRNKPIYEVTLTPVTAKNGISFVTLYIDKQTFHPLFIEVMQDNGSLSKITITAYHIKQVFSDKMFIFDKKKYPDVEEIDLR